MGRQEEKVLQGFLDGLRPPKRLTPSQWADEYRYLSSKASAEPGRWRTSRTPYLAEIMDCFSTRNPVREVVVMKGAQVGLTEAGFNVAGYFIDTDPGPIMYVMPTDNTVKKNSRIRFDPMIEASPSLRDKVAEAKSRSGGNTLFQKEFPGGVIVFTSARSGSNLRSMPVRVLLLDEVDAYPVTLGEEGSPVKLALARTNTFANRKILYISTPTADTTSVIAPLFEGTDCRYFHVPCPECGTAQSLEFSRLRYDVVGVKAHNVRYECAHCGNLIEERHKPVMLQNGEWLATKPENADRYRRGYHLSSLYSPLGWFSWVDAVNTYLEAKAERDDSKMRVFTNTILGETWKEEVVVPKPELLLDRKTTYRRNEIPDDVAVLTAGVDVQNNRLEVEIVGWSEGYRSSSIDYRVLVGDTDQDDVWSNLGELLYERWTRPNGDLIGLSKVAVDSGFNSNAVYRFCRKHSPSLVFPIKGRDTNQPTMISGPKTVDIRHNGLPIGTVGLFTLNTSLIKSELYPWLMRGLDENGVKPMGYCSFPEGYELEYFQMLCAEQRVVRLNRSGYLVYEWQKLRSRNEALDCRVYARSALALLGVDRWKPTDWEAERRRSYYPPNPTQPNIDVSLPTTDDTNRQKRKTRRRDSFWT